jgi:signal peptidase II
MNQNFMFPTKPARFLSAWNIGRWLMVMGLYALDQATKWLVMMHLDPYTSHPVIPGFFDLVFVGNTGAAFGSFRNSNTAFIVISTVTLAALVFFQWRRLFRDRMSQTGAALLMAGILGNLTDRIRHHHVIDFLDFHAGGHHWPAFNVADSCICVAVGIFFIASFREERKKGAQT